MRRTRWDGCFPPDIVRVLSRAVSGGWSIAHGSERAWLLWGSPDRSGPIGLRRTLVQTRVRAMAEVAGRSMRPGNCALIVAEGRRYCASPTAVAAVVGLGLGRSDLSRRLGLERPGGRAALFTPRCDDGGRSCRPRADLAPPGRDVRE